MKLFDRFKRKKDGRILPPQESASVSSSQPRLENKEDQKEAEPVQKKETKQWADIVHVLIRPVVSEKTTFGEAKGVYTFIVRPHATKTDVARAIFIRYRVRPIGIRMVNYQGKYVRFGRTQGKRSDWKKAYIMLPKDIKIDIHEGV